jgi:hypothetical protein
MELKMFALKLAHLLPDSISLLLWPIRPREPDVPASFHEKGIGLRASARYLELFCGSQDHYAILLSE